VTYSPLHENKFIVDRLSTQFNTMSATFTSFFYNPNQGYQVVGIGNYGLGVYSQNVSFHHDRYTGIPRVDRELDFVPIGDSIFGVVVFL
jgi:hypothetical protein